MIETSCTDCPLSNVQDHQTTSASNRKQQHLLGRRHQVSEQESNHSKVNKTTRPRLNYLPNYLNNNHHHQPLLSPHFFLTNFNATGLSVANGGANVGGTGGSPTSNGPGVAGGGGPGAPGGGGGGQFGLTPDARACVTATYLCVLIVNNTWLDCNLLEMLCNGTNSNGTNNNGGHHNQNHNGQRRDHDDQDSMVRDAQNATRWLTDGKRDEFAALESAMSGLIAFAGGTEEDEGGGSGNDESRQNYNTGLLNQQQPVPLATEPRDHIYLAPVNLRPEPDKNRRRPMEPHDRGGGGDDDGGGGGAASGDDDSEDQIGRPELYHSAMGHDEELSGVVVELPEKMGRLVDEDKNRILENYFNLRKHQIRQKQIHEQQADRHQVQQHHNHHSQLQSRQINAIYENNQVGPSTTPNETSAESTTELPSEASSTPSSSFISWMGRPFRGWGSYIFWPINSNVGPNSELNAHQQAATKHQASVEFLPIALADSSRQMQMLRPIDRSEQYNDISTNQSSLKLAAAAAAAATNDAIQSMETEQQHSIFSSPMPTTTLYPEFFPSEPASSRQQQMAPTTSNVVHLAPIAPNNLAPHVIGFDFNPHRLVGGHQPHLGQQQRFNEQHEPSRNCRCAETTGSMDEYDCQLQCSSGSPGLGPGNPQQVSTVPTTTTTTTPLLVALNGGATSTSLPSTSTLDQSNEPQQQQMVTSSSFTTSTSTTISPNAKMNPLDISFLLYTRHHQHLALELAKMSGVQVNGNNNNNNLASSVSDSLVSISDIIDLTNETSLSNVFKLNSSLPIKIIIHGFGSGGRRPWVTDMVFKLLDYEDVNVIVVDWEKGATLPNYVQAAGNTRLVGHKIASLIKSMSNKYKLTGNSFHLIGFSLGAHVAGFAGMEIRNSTRHLINRITGLDPASPLFEGYEANDRLDPSDAQFVDVIHSNGDGVLRGGFGSLQPMGHVDFYPNGGRVQVGCNSVILSALSDIIYGKWQSLCNHRRALNFFMDSFEFNKCRFKSFNCDSYDSYLRGDCFDCGQNNEKCSYMGYLANYSKGRGKMYLTTHEEAPFCANQFMIKIVGSKGYKTHLGKVEVTLVTADGKNESFLLSSINDRQTSNSYDLNSSGQKEPSQHSMQSLIVAYPSLVNYTHVLLRYTKYKGWIYSGDESWPIDKVYITDSDGQVKSYCGLNTVLESHITTRLQLEPGNCTVDESATSPVGLQKQQQQQVITSGRALGAPPTVLGVGPVSANGQQDGQQQQQQTSAQQQQQQQTAEQQSQQQQPAPSTSSRSPRLFASMMQQLGANSGSGEPTGAMNFQRMGGNVGPLQGHFALSAAGLPHSISHQPIAAY